MSTIQDFKNAPAGATATHKTMGIRVMKINDAGQYWITPRGGYLSNEEVALRDFALDASAPTTAREALDLAWELAHEVKEGQTIPEGTRYLEFPNSELREYTAPISLDISPALVPKVRTHEPLPDPKPDWLDAPAVLANDHRDRLVIFFPVADRDKYWQSAQTGVHYHWAYLTDVVPLYPKDTARPLPTREEIANTLHGDNCPDDPDPDECCSCGAGDYDRMGDIVLDLLKGQDK